MHVEVLACSQVIGRGEARVCAGTHRPRFPPPLPQPPHPSYPQSRTGCGRRGTRTAPQSCAGCGAQCSSKRAACGRQLRRRRPSSSRRWRCWRWGRWRRQRPLLRAGPTACGASVENKGVVSVRCWMAVRRAPPVCKNAPALDEDAAPIVAPTTRAPAMPPQVEVTSAQARSGKWRAHPGATASLEGLPPLPHLRVLSVEAETRCEPPRNLTYDTARWGPEITASGCAAGGEGGRGNGHRHGSESQCRRGGAGAAGGGNPCWPASCEQA